MIRKRERNAILHCDLGHSSADNPMTYVTDNATGTFAREKFGLW